MGALLQVRCNSMHIGKNVHVYIVARESDPLASMEQENCTRSITGVCKEREVSSTANILTVVANEPHYFDFITTENTSLHLHKSTMVKEVLDLVDAECSTLCSKTTGSVSPFRVIPIQDLPDFTWNIFADDLKAKAPTLYALASGIVSHSDHRNATKKGDAHIPSICMAIGALLKERNREMCGIQSVVSVALFASQVPKKVS